MRAKKEKYLNNLKYYRKQSDLSQTEFANKCGWYGCQARVANYEAGLREPSLSDVRRMIGVLMSAGVTCTLDDVFPTEVRKKA